jgi:hypothetical protein
MPYQAIYQAFLWPVQVMDLYINQGQVYCYMDFFCASLGWTFFPMRLTPRMDGDLPAHVELLRHMQLRERRLPTHEVIRGHAW